MKRNILFLVIGGILSSNVAFANQDIKQTPPNQYDCTIDELELYIMKRTENLRKESAIVTWEDFKKTSQIAKAAPSSSPSNGNAQSEMKEKNTIQKSGGTTGEAVDDCPLFFEDIPDLEMPEFNLDNLGGMLSGGLSDLQDLANQQMEQLASSLMDVLREGVCERLSTDYLTELGTDVLDDALKEEIGYTTKDVAGGNFANEVINDALKDEFGTSNAKLLNVMDDELNDNRERYMERQFDKKLDDIEDNTIDSIQK